VATDPFEKNQTKSKNSKESNGRGGARKNAGRRTGSATKRTREIADKAAEQGLTPLEFMLEIMRTEPSAEIEDQRILQSRLELRFEAAKACAPYMHPRLAAVEVSGPDGGPIQITSKEQRDAAVGAALRADT
jgi:hypothetical protein